MFVPKYDSKCDSSESITEIKYLITMHPINSYVCTSCLLPMDGNCISDFYLYSSIASLSGTIPTERILRLSNYNGLYMYVCSYLSFIFPDT